MTDELDDLVGAVAQDDVFPLEPGTQALGNRAAEFVTAAVGVEVGTLQSAVHRLQRLRGRPQRVLIGSEFDDLLLAQAEVAGQFLDRLAGFVDGQLQDVLMCGLPHAESLGEG